MCWTTTTHTIPRPSASRSAPATGTTATVRNRGPRTKDKTVTQHATNGPPVPLLQELLLESENITGFLDAVTTTIAAALSQDGEEVWCAVTLLRARRSTTVAASGPDAEALDELQYHYGDGPCLTAAREHRMVHVADTRTDPRWPAYGKAAAEAGILSALGVPMELGEEATAGVNVYAHHPHAFDEATLAVIQREVAATSTTLRLAVRMENHRDTETDLQAAMASRTTIDLAVGIVMGQNRCPQERAFEILRAASNHRNVKLRDLAAELVATVGAGPATTHFDA
jgi:putative methionine-R-sulfoxide reductase with GAF domain